MIVTGLGSLPGEDMPGALRMTFDLTGDLPYLPELPARGPEAAMIGRGTAVLVDVGADRLPTGWRIGAGRSGEQRRARDLLARDLDDLEIAAFGYAGPLKVSVVGPWTLAACLELPRGGRVLADRAARADLVQSLAEGVAGLVAQVRRKVPGAELVVQLDEPLLPAVADGQVRTASGLDRYRRVDRPDLSDGVRTVVTTVPDTRWALHCCAAGAPWDLVADLVSAVAVDQDVLRGADWDVLAGFVEGGGELWLGAHPSDPPDVLTKDRVAARALSVLRPLELPGLGDTVALTPACGLAGYTPATASAVVSALRGAAEIIETELGG